MSRFPCNDDHTLQDPFVQCPNCLSLPGEACGYCSYTLRISEAQRRLIVEALTNSPDIIAKAIDRYPSTGSAHHDVTYLLDCLKELPASEAETPDVLHGLCL